MYKPTTIWCQPTFPSLFKITVLGSALAALGLTGCSSTSSTTHASKSKMVGSSGYLDANSLDGLEDLLSATDMRAVEGDRLQVLKHGDVWKRMTVGFKMDLNHWDTRIEAQRGWFASRQPYIDRLSARASRYLYHTVKEAERRGMPTELALLPVIESSYDPAATSSAAAAGLWQFIPSTGRIYGLKQTSMYDGRRDVVESTRAAYEFLGSLYNQFGSWELALASYNAGPGRIQQAINRNKAAGLPTDYWSLKLPQETMNYVPRFLAVAQIIKNPDAYGVSLPPIANRPHFREVMVGPASLDEVSSVTGLSRSELYALNPGHRGEVIDTGSPMKILIPADISPSVDAKLKKMKSSAGGYWAGGFSQDLPQNNVTIAPSRETPPALNTKTAVPSISAPPVLASAKVPAVAVKPAVAVSSNSALGRPQAQTPRGSDALAAFASSTNIPSAPRIPVAVTPAAPVKAVSAEPPLSAKEREQIMAAIKAEGETKTVDEVLKPVATKAEQDEVVQELTALAPKGTEIVDPYDGKIKLTAIQTSQSIADQQGKELTKGFAYPKSVAENTRPDSDEAKRNLGKNYIKTDSEVVVVAPKGKRSTYTVQSGDTLAVIAMKNGVNWRDIAKWNQMDADSKLFVGTVIYLYDAKPAAQQEESKSKVQPENYVVKANDSLTGVASQFGLSVKQLADFNNISTTSGLIVGQKLSLKETAASKAKLEADSKKAEAEKKALKVPTKTYTVKRGEYLKLIADRYALSNQELADLTSGLTASSNLMAGQKINVPLNDVESVSSSNAKPAAKAEPKAEAKFEPSYKTESYSVQRGDTLYSVAAQSKISVSELAEINNIAANTGLRAGQSLKVPAIKKTPEQYVVQPGDTLSALAGRYDLTIDYIANVNGINRNNGLRVGQKLQLTGDAPEEKAEVKPAMKAEAKSSSKNDKASSGFVQETHTVKSGETLTSIAQKYHLQLNYLADLNNLSRTSSVRIGQKLKIASDLPEAEKSAAPAAAKPAPAPSRSTESYTVKAGESLNSIAGRTGLGVAELADMNSLSARAGLRVGQKIQIPKTITEYRIKRGDTLIGLASRYGMESGALAELNNLQPSASLRIGDVIKVPN
ncbi:LysM peptidoglycan-binding domain-containing protein [Acinetobacter bouvetii]|uniref:LysM peptidoglycan-binding domain-containing protein n=1 Tax=Acinetobacter bouvetii TaxID=202951 RepID=A0A4Q7ATF4_9GAMM|nr:LysM peptidoglycan-binding domain-containing protein [Acinetobacter bouvetii]RZG64912.1 LysM peptidoglycan-binding domain-containing protein [Acinetobacter bouvetii]